jgi:hypothetical protein
VAPHYGVSPKYSHRDWEFDSYRRLQGHSVFATINIPLSGLFAGKPPPQ